MILVLFSYFVYFYVLRKIRIVVLYKVITLSVQVKYTNCTISVQAFISYMIFIFLFFEIFFLSH